MTLLEMPGWTAKLAQSQKYSSRAVWCSAKRSSKAGLGCEREALFAERRCPVWEWNQARRSLGTLRSKKGTQDGIWGTSPSLKDLAVKEMFG